VLDIYFQQCSILVTARDLALMRLPRQQRREPITGVQALRADLVRRS